MVGTGDSLPSCGDMRSEYEACSSDTAHFLRYRPVSCNRWPCPIDYRRLAAREANKAEQRMRGIHDAHLKAGFELGIPVHLILSPPESTYGQFSDFNSFSKLRAQARSLAESIGIVGGCMVVHNKRGTNKQIEAYRQGYIDLPDSWHFHIVGFLPQGHKLKSNEVHTKTGWIYKRIDFRVAKFKTVFNIVNYELKHAAYNERVHILTWFGVCSYNSVKSSKIISKSVVKCKVCGHEIHRYRDGIDIGEKIIRREVITYWLDLTLVNRLTKRYTLPKVPCRFEIITDYTEKAISITEKGICL